MDRNRVDRILASRMPEEPTVPAEPTVPVDAEV
jgi:hypothetical protein